MKLHWFQILSLSLSLFVSFYLWTPSIISLTALGYQVLSCLSMLIEIWLLLVGLFFGLFGCRNFRLFMHFLPGSLRSLYGRSWMFIWAIRVNILIQYISALYLIAPACCCYCAYAACSKCHHIFPFLSCFCYSCVLLSVFGAGSSSVASSSRHACHVSDTAARINEQCPESAPPSASVRCLLQRLYSTAQVVV